MVYIIRMIILTLLQALLLNQILLFGVAMPLLAVYFVMLIPRGFARWLGMLMAFAMGLAVDMFCNTPGVNAGAMTLVAFVQPYILELYMENDDEPNLIPHVKTMGFLKYMTYALFLVTIFCVAYFTLDAFSYFYWLKWLESVGGSMVMTLIMILVIDGVRR